MTVELVGEDGRLLVRQIVRLDENQGGKVGLFTGLDYEIPGTDEPGRLRISIKDAFGRLKALASVDLTLLSTGNPELNPTADQLTRIVIQQPELGEQIQGGSLIIAGLAQPLSQNPLLGELVTEAGKVVGFRLIGVVDASAEKSVAEYRPFSAEISYSIDEPTWVRLLVSERGEEIQGTIYLTNIEIFLNP